MTDAAPSAAPSAARSGPAATDNNWHPGEAATHEDPLLDALVILTQLHGNPFTAAALSAGLPLVDNRLTPSLLPRAATRAGLTARIVRKPAAEISPGLLPAILLLHDRRACVMLERLPNGGARVRFPEAGESADELSADELAVLYTGLICFVRPRFRFEARAPQVKALKANHWFWGTVFENWRLYRDTLLAALIVNLFALAIPMFSMTVYDRVVPNHAVETLWVLAIGAILVLGFDFMLRTLRAYIVDTAGKRIDVQLSARIMERVLGLRMDARPASVGSFAANLRAFEGVRDFIASATVTTLIDLPFVLLFLLVMVWISPWLLLPPLVGMLLVLFVTLVSQDKMHELTETTYRASAQRNATLVESLVGLETLKTLSAESLVQRQWERATLFIAQVSGRLKLLSAGTVNFAQLMQQLVNIAVIIVGVYELSAGNMSMGGIIAASMLSGRAMAPLGQVAGLMMQYQSARTSLASVNTHMELPVERPEGASFVHRATFSGEIEFKDVSFCYPGRDEAVLKKVSFKLKAGEKVGIIGRIGSGKTTIEKLVLGLYQPTEGSVFVDGIDARQIDPAELRRAIGFVPQDVTLFYGTLKHNIAMGAPFADDSAILAAAELAGVKEFADTHPQGFEMPIGERGESLSGGQRQAVAIARAMLNDPPILLLDEPSSSMDHQSEEGLKQRLRRFAATKTIILVTHRTSLLDLVDRLIVLDQGRIVADGPKAQVVEALQQGRIGRAG
ncbi:MULTISPECIES: type I secretion system permease/ATPase [Zoogloea]|jgi:ATP-binding cassette subfamily C protein LapB|uniref:Cyclolysin secretion/processing ATP-binding protein CyaB n=1 Tax=Zoogloea oleivorans TaxID=1552750 RepID=A0A6C2CD11_9RHOO|nr:MULTISPECIES: type I secretion system permease/ATPase [Zoogloea]MBP8133740.1 type I secretion system permease/ATPase [Zoogloea sp.]MDD2669845.1 type I secretion system permease/ATPase [Zoogloea sp.]MDY0038114.1 type I secretion system permease/ATPase [Zoogloea oleivorans]TYC51576.1 type I secretion system permease/ATPase [Zoogloea oleivorans]